MKNYLFLCFLFFTFIANAQLNELSISFQPLNIGDYGRGASLSYHRNISSASAIGLRTSFLGMDIEDYYNSYIGSIDLVNRRNWSGREHFRFMTELGISGLRRFEESLMYWFCGTGLTDQELSRINHLSSSDDWIQTNYWGFVASVGMDVDLGKRLFVGASYKTSLYFNNQEYTYENKISPSNLNFNLGVRF